MFDYLKHIITCLMVIAVKICVMINVLPRIQFFMSICLTTMHISVNSFVSAFVRINQTKLFVQAAVALTDTGKILKDAFGPSE